MTVTDEDRKAAAECLETLLLATEPTMMSPLEAEQLIMRAFSAHRQAAYAAGLERAANHDAAAKVLYQYACNMAVGLARAGDLEGYKESLWFKMANAIADAMPDAIRAEKDKT